MESNPREYYQSWGQVEILQITLENRAKHCCSTPHFVTKENSRPRSTIESRSRHLLAGRDGELEDLDQMGRASWWHAERCHHPVAWCGAKFLSTAAWQRMASPPLHTDLSELDGRYHCRAR
jgi:hypothetical protein